MLIQPLRFSVPISIHFLFGFALALASDLSSVFGSTSLRLLFQLFSTEFESMMLGIDDDSIASQ